MKSNWRMEKLGEVCEILNGGTPDTKIASYWGSDHFWITPKDMGKLSNIYVEETSRKITASGLKNSSARTLPPNSIILSSRAPIGHLAINCVPMATNQGCKGLVPKKEVHYLFLYYFLSNSVELMNKLGSGTTFKELSGSKLGNIEIPIPPIEEQQRIVGILDEAFEKIEKAKENTVKNLQNSKDLFASYLQSVFENPGEDWEEKRLGDILQKTETINPLNNPDKEFTYIDVSSVNKGNLSIENTSQIIGRNAPSRARKLVKTDDVIFATVRPTLRRIAIIPKEFDKQVCSTGYFVLRSKEYLNNKLVFYFVQTKEFNDKMEKLQKGASYPAVTDSQVRDQIISYPKSLSEQKSIVAKLDALSEQTKKLEAIYKQKLADLDELKKSVLKRAFEGKLE